MRRQSVLVGPLAEVRSPQVSMRPALPCSVSQRLGYCQVLLHVVDGRVQLTERPVRWRKSTEDRAPVERQDKLLQSSVENSFKNLKTVFFGFRTLG